MSLHDGLYEWSAWAWPLIGAHLWQSTLFGVVALVFVALLRRAPARSRHAICIVASLKFALPSMLFLFAANQFGVDLTAMRAIALLESHDPPPVAWAAEQAFATADHATIEGTVVALNTPRGHSEIYCALTIGWAAGSALLLGLWFQRRRRFAMALKAGRTVSAGREVDALVRALSTAGSTSRPRLIISPQVTEPGVWRTWRPVIALPENLIDHLSDPELDAMLLHELVHIARRDNLIGNLQMLLCCLFWFHPLLWFIDRRTLAERERATDERVTALGAPPTVYAASLLKVLRFCLGWKVAGISSASGSNMQRRVEMIMNNKTLSKTSTFRQRMLVASVAAGVLLFSIVTGALDHSGVMGQSAGALHANRGHGPNSTAAAAASPRARTDLDSGFETESDQVLVEQSPTPPSGETDIDLQDVKDLNNKAEEAPYTSVRFENSEASPLRITDAKVKVVRFEASVLAPASGDAPKYEMVTQPSVTLRNNTNRRVTFVRVAFHLPPVSNDVMGRDVAIEPNASYVLRLDGRLWSVTAPVGSVKNMVITLRAVRFEDGEEWGLLQSAGAPPEASIWAGQPLAATAAPPTLPADGQPMATPPAAPAVAWESRPALAPPTPRAAIAGTEPSDATPAPRAMLAGQPPPGEMASPMRAFAAPRAGHLARLSPPAARADMADPAEAASVLAAPGPRTYATPPPAAAAPASPSGSPRAAAQGSAILYYVPAKYINPDGAPLVISDASSGVIERGGGSGGKDLIYLPQVRLTNDTNRRITAVKLRFKWDAPGVHAVTARVVSIEPRGSISFRNDMVVSGNPEQMKVQVVAVEFEDGGKWGSMNSMINSGPDWLPAPPPAKKK